MTNVLLLGAGGFIGGNVLARWLATRSDYQIWAVDIQPTPPNAAAADLGARYHVLNKEQADFAPILQLAAFDVCINCMGAANVSASFADPATDYRLNVDLLARLLEALRLYAPQCRLIQLSSAAVYGEARSIPVAETAPLQPLSPYGYHKKMAEELCTMYTRCFSVPTCALRIFSAYGEGLQKQIFWDIAAKARQNAESLELWGTGRESRDFIYIADLLRVLECVIDKAAFEGEAINVAAGEEVFIREAAQTLLSALGYAGKLRFSQREQIGYPLRWRADISQLRALGFQPSYALADGLANYAEWIRQFHA